MLLTHHDAHHALTQHVLPVDPRMHFHEEFCPVFACGTAQLTLAAGVKRQVGRDIVYFTLVARPGGLALATIHLLQQGGRDANHRVDARQVFA